LLRLLTAAYDPSRHFACPQRSGRFRAKADIERQAQPTASVEIDPTEKSAVKFAVLQRASFPITLW
jgi:hypothetical protein